MANKGKVTALDAKENQKGVLHNTFPIVLFNKNLIAKANHFYSLVDPVNSDIIELELPDEGHFESSDEIEITNNSSKNFKVILKKGSRVTIQINELILKSSDNNFIISLIPGSYIRLKAQNNLKWIVVNSNYISVGE